MDIEITDRASWLAYRADWRARYAEASENIRAQKRDIQKLRITRKEKGQTSEGLKAESQANCLYNSNLHWLRRKANHLMIELESYKAYKNNLLNPQQEAA